MDLLGYGNIYREGSNLRNSYSDNSCSNYNLCPENDPGIKNR